ncbi:unnamed protein product [Adineta steineri]|uniref:Uncharacterized protein n=1 Tax=Adineta steineri TaxID=433720 RepID=A0A814ZBN0_9BILA|nr:unnamed protein product [Adineta steineri]CAF1529031.1 unnamed protein product [Adineta steineri]
MEQIIYDKLNLTTDLPNKDHKTYLNTIIKDYCMKRVWTDSPIIKDILHLLTSPNQILNNELNSIINQDLIESFNELATYYAQMAIKDLDLNQQHHPLLNACHSLASTLHSEQVTWHSTHLRLIQLIERFPRLEPFLIILNKYGLHLKDILNGEKNGLDIFFGDDEIEQTFHSICQYLQLQYEQQQNKDNSFENYRLRIFWLTDRGLLIDLYYADSDPIQLENAQQTFNTHITNQIIDLYDTLNQNESTLIIIQKTTSNEILQRLDERINQTWLIFTEDDQNNEMSIIFVWQLDQISLNENNDDLAFNQNEELICGPLSLIIQTIQKSSPHLHPFIYFLTDHAQFNNDSNLNIIPSPFIGLAQSFITEYE